MDAENPHDHRCQIPGGESYHGIPKSCRMLVSASGCPKKGVSLRRSRRICCLGSLVPLGTLPARGNVGDPRIAKKDDPRVLLQLHPQYAAGSANGPWFQGSQNCSSKVVPLKSSP